MYDPSRLCFTCEDMRAEETEQPTTLANAYSIVTLEEFGESYASHDFWIGLTVTI